MASGFRHPAGASAVDPERIVARRSEAENRSVMVPVAGQGSSRFSRDAVQRASPCCASSRYTRFCRDICGPGCRPVYRSRGTRNRRKLIAVGPAVTQLQSVGGLRPPYPWRRRDVAVMGAGAQRAGDSGRSHEREPVSPASTVEVTPAASVAGSPSDGEFKARRRRIEHWAGDPSPRRRS